MLIEKKISKLIQEAEERWTNKVHEKWHAPEGLFAKGSAEEIAKAISQDKKVPLKTAMARLNFFLNRGGKNVSPEIRGKIEKAKEILHKMYKTESKA